MRLISGVNLFMDRFTLKRSHWYAAEIIGEEFGSKIRSRSPIRVEEITPKGGRNFELSFYHANYPEGTRNKVYQLQTLERNRHFIFAQSRSHQPIRWMLIHSVTVEWLQTHFSISIGEGLDVETWLQRNA